MKINWITATVLILLLFCSLVLNVVADQSNGEFQLILIKNIINLTKIQSQQSVSIDICL